MIVWPVLVQGRGAAEQIAAAVHGFSNFDAEHPHRPDLVIVARGGGSIEDLWSFNEEIVARAIAASSIPVISAVGHETDTTLADFAADLRAPTPTAAAELAVPVLIELANQLAELGLRQRRCALRPVSLGRERLAARAQRLPLPSALLARFVQATDEVGERLRRGLAERTAGPRGRLDAIGGRLSLPLLKARRDRAQTRLDGAARVLVSLNPLSVLKRGYVQVTGATGRTLTTRAAAAQASALTLHFHDGQLAVSTSGAPTRPAPKPKAPPPEQGKLL